MARVISDAMDGAPSMTGKKDDVVAKLNEKVHAANEGLGLRIFRCIINEEAMRCSSLIVDHAMEVVKTASFIFTRCLNSR